MNAPRQITGRTVLFGMLAFFGVIFAVNGLFVYFALDSWPGLRFDKAYERGLNYNRILNEAKSQAALRWRSSLRVTQTADDGHLVDVRLTDGDGNPLTALAIHVDFSRPAHADADFSVQLTASAPGIYQTTTRFPLTGRWHATVTARRAETETYKMIHDIMVAP